MPAPAKPGQPGRLPLFHPTAAATSLDLDAYILCTAVARLLDRMLLAAAQPVRVLQVGPGSAEGLPRVLNPDLVTITRHGLDRPGHARPWPFAADAFDAVVFLDGLGAVAPSDRRLVLEECLRVARYGFVLSCPNTDPEVVGHKALAAAAHQYRNGTPPPDLGQCADGLPGPEEIQTLLDGLGVPRAALDNHPLNIWLPGRILHDTLAERTEFSGLVRSWINQTFCAGLFDHGRPGYRKIYVCAKAPQALASPDVPGPSPAAEHLPAPAAGLQDMATLVARAINALVHDHEERTRCLRDELQGLRQELVRHEPVAAELRDCRAEVHALAALVASSRQSRLYRLARPLRLVRRWLRPPAYGPGHLLPLRGLTRRGSGPENAWQVGGPDQEFLVPAQLPPGWVRLRLRMHATAAGRACLWVHGGEGVRRVEAFDLEEHSTLTFERYVQWATETWALRFQPLDRPGTVVIEEFRVEALPRPAMLLRALVFKAKGGLGRFLRRGLVALVRGRLREFKAGLRAELPDVRHVAVPDRPPLHGADQPDDYARWVDAHRLADADRERLSAEAVGRAGCLSLLLPVHGGTSVRALRETLVSVQRQLDPRWELCVAHDGASPQGVRQFLEEHARDDSRIKVAGEASGGIAAVCNRALARATGDFVALLDAGDELAEDAVGRVARALDAQPPIDMVYTDEDRLGPGGRRNRPFFKPDWSPEHFLASLYTGRLAAYRAALVRAAGGFRSEVEGAAEQDLVLRLVARGAAIHHLPHVLYHRRGKPAGDNPAARQALEDYLALTGTAARVEALPHPGLYRVRFALRDRPKVSIIIPTAYRGVTVRGERTRYLTKLFESIHRKTTYENYELIVVESDDLSAAGARELDRWQVKRVRYSGPVNIGAKMNRGAAAATGTHFLFLNDDMEVITPDWLEALLEYSQQPAVGVVGAKLFFPDGRLQHVGMSILNGQPLHNFYGAPGDHTGHFGNTVVPHNASCVTGACIMTRAEVFHAVGGFDEGFAIDFNDVDYSMRVRATGKRVVFTPFAQLYHHEGVSKSPPPAQEKVKFKQRYAGQLDRDPYYNPNLSRDRAFFEIAQPAPSTSACARAA